MSLKDLIGIVPDLFGLFLPGFLFVSIYNWIKAIRRDIGVITVVSLITTYIIRLAYSTIHQYVLSDVAIPQSLAASIYLITGAVLPFFIVCLQEANCFGNALHKISHKSINDNVLRDVLSCKKPIILCIYTRSSNLHVLGYFREIEEKGADSYLIMDKYRFFDDKDNEIDNYSNGRSLLVISMKDVERMEVLYEEGSKIWDKLKTAE